MNKQTNATKAARAAAEAQRRLSAARMEDCGGGFYEPSVALLNAFRDEFASKGDLYDTLQLAYNWGFARGRNYERNSIRRNAART